LPKVTDVVCPKTALREIWSHGPHSLRNQTLHQFIPAPLINEDPIATIVGSVYFSLIHSMHSLLTLKLRVRVEVEA
jgi:hypothetical protein